MIKIRSLKVGSGGNGNGSGDMGKKIQISKNDLKALRWIAEQGAMNVEQLNKAIWDGKTTTYARFRVKALFDAGYLEEFPESFSRAPYYRITRKAYNTLCDHNLNHPHRTPFQKIRVIDLHHYSALTDLRIHCEKSGKIADWISDRVLALDPSIPRDRFKQTLPDAIYVTKSGRRMALEYERTRKSRPRVLSKIHAYIDELMRKDRFVDFVVWVVTNQSKQEAHNLASYSNAQEVFTLEGFKEDFNPASHS